MAPKRKAQAEPAAVEPVEEVNEAPSLRRSGRNHIAPVEKAKPAPKKAKSKKTDIEEEPAAVEDAPKEEEPKPAEEEAKAEAPAEAASGGVKVDQAIPLDIKIKNQDDKDITVKDLVAENGAVIFLVPKANTPGCTTQACAFRDSYKEFQDAGFDVYSLSQDTPKALTGWKTSKELNYNLISDPSQALIKVLGGSAGAKKVTRSHFVLSKGDAKLLLASVGVKPKDSASAVLAFIKSL